MNMRTLRIFPLLAFVVACWLALAPARSLYAQVSYLQIVGNTTYQLDFGAGTARLGVDRIANSSPTYTTGTLKLELWATTSPYSGGGISGYEVAAYQIGGSSNGTLGPNQYFYDIDVTVPILSVPPAGSYYATMIVAEYDPGCGSSDHFCIDTWASFSSPLVIGGGGGGAAPVCSVSVTPSSLPSSGGTVSVRADCSGSPTSYTWSDTAGSTGIGDIHGASFTDTFGANTGASAFTDTFTVVAYNGAGASSPASASVSIAGDGGGNGGFAIGAGITGTWVDSAGSGAAGFGIEVLAGNMMVAEWYTYGAQGGQAYIGGVGPYSGNRAIIDGFQIVGPGAQFPPYFNPGLTQTVPWGRMMFTFIDCTHAHVDWAPLQPGYANGGLDLIRLTTPLGSSCP